jgi:hypothetical protein
MGRVLQDPPPGELIELAKIARSYAGKLTLRQLEIKTGVSKASIGNILNGYTVSYGTALAFAMALRQPVNPLREAMGMPPMYPDPGMHDEATQESYVLPVPDPNAWKEQIPPGLRHLPERILKKSHELANVAGEQSYHETYNTIFRAVAQAECEAASGNNVPEHVTTDPESRPQFPSAQKSVGHLLRNPAPPYLAAMLAADDKTKKPKTDKELTEEAA